jgi:hypothetical protein
MTTRLGKETDDRGIAWWVLLVELILLVILSIPIGILIFSLLPVSVALVVLAFASLTFPFVRSRIASWLHVALVLLSWFILTITFTLLVATHGRDSFKWLLDWN